jgi:hypothetical protein
VVIVGRLSDYNEARARDLDARPLAILLRNPEQARSPGSLGRTHLGFLIVERFFCPRVRSGRLDSRILATAEEEAGDATVPRGIVRRRVLTKQA